MHYGAKGATMRTFTLIVALLAVLCAGCVKLNLTLVIRETGAGTIQIGYSIAEQTVAQLEAMRRLEKNLRETARADSPSPAQEDYTRLLFNPVKDEIVSLLKEYEKFGITTEKVEVRSRDMRREVEVRVRFADLAKLAQTGLFRQYGFALRKDQKGNYVLSRPAQNPRPGGEPKPVDPETAKQLNPLLGGFSVTLTVHTPGPVLKATAPASSPSSVTWSFEYDRDPNAILAIQDQDFAVVFDGQGLNLPEISLAPQPDAKRDRTPGSDR